MAHTIADWQRRWMVQPGGGRAQYAKFWLKGRASFLVALAEGNCLYRGWPTGQLCHQFTVGAQLQAHYEDLVVIGLLSEKLASESENAIGVYLK